MKLRKIIKTVRNDRGWTFRQMAEYLDSTPAAIFKYEKGVQPRDVKKILYSFQKLGYDVGCRIETNEGTKVVDFNQVLDPNYTIKKI